MKKRKRVVNDVADDGWQRDVIQRAYFLQCKRTQAEWVLQWRLLHWLTAEEKFRRIFCAYGDFHSLTFFHLQMMLSEMTNSVILPVISSNCRPLETKVCYYCPKGTVVLFGIQELACALFRRNWWAKWGKCNRGGGELLTTKCRLKLWKLIFKAADKDTASNWNANLVIELFSFLVLSPQEMKFANTSMITNRQKCGIIQNCWPIISWHCFVKKTNK